MGKHPNMKILCVCILYKTCAVVNIGPMGQTLKIEDIRKIETGYNHVLTINIFNQTYPICTVQPR